MTAVHRSQQLALILKLKLEPLDAAHDGTLKGLVGDCSVEKDHVLFDYVYPFYYLLFFSVYKNYRNIYKKNERTLLLKIISPTA